MDWNDIKMLVEIARAGSFAGAASTLSIHPASVGRRVSALEKVGNTRLFRREPGGAILTDAGKRLLRQALRVEDEAISFERILRTFATSAVRPVTIEASEGVITYLLAPLIAKQHWGPLGVSASKLMLDLPPIRTVPLGRMEEAVDLRVLWSTPESLPVADPTDHIRKVAEIRFVPFFSSDYVPQSGISFPDRFEDLSSHPLLTLEQYSWFNSAASMQDWHVLTQQAKNGLVSASDSALLGLMTVQGGGVSLLPTYSVAYTNLLRYAQIPMPDIRTYLWLVASQEALKEPLVRRCFDVLGRAFLGADWEWKP